MTFLNKLKKIGKKVTKTVDKLEEKYEVSEKLDNLKDKTSDILEDVAEKVEDISDTVSEKIEAKLEDKITFDDFAKVELKLGKILEAEEIKKSKKLYKLKVDFGEEEPRQILSGIKEYYEADNLVGKKVLFVTNLLPRKIMGYESNGMILGLQGEKEFSLLVADRKKVEEGVQAG
jgi:methionyl-tRNA synthetase